MFASEEYRSTSGHGKCTKKCASFRKNQGDPIKKNDYTPILVIFAEIARNHGKFAGLVRLQMRSDSSDFCVLLCFSLPFVWHPTTPVARFVVVVYWSKVGQNWQMSKMSNLAWIIPQVKLWYTDQERCFSASPDAPLSIGTSSAEILKTFEVVEHFQWKIKFYQVSKTANRVDFFPTRELL